MLLTIVLVLWASCFAAGLYVIALAMVSWLDPDAEFKGELTPINRK